MSATSSSARSLADAKAKRQKQILAVGSVILLALVGFQLPRLLGGRGGQTAAPADSGAVVQPAPIASGPAGSLPDTDRVVVQPGSGQLISFGLFKSKDPFVQQLGTNATLTPATPAAPGLAPVTAPIPTTTTSQPHTPPRRTAPNGGLTPVTTTTPSAGSTVPFPSTTPVTTLPAVTAPSPVTPSPVAPVVPTTPATTTTAPVTAPTSVLISTNGLCGPVSVNGTFPQGEDIFRVVSIAKDGKSAKVAVVGGAYDSGAAAVTLKLGQKVTLVNTADGARYVLLLAARCDVTTQPVGAPTTPTSTVAAPLPPTTVSTPIVTDALDSTPPGG